MKKFEVHDVYESGRAYGLDTVGAYFIAARTDKFVTAIETATKTKKRLKIKVYDGIEFFMFDPISVVRADRQVG